MCHDKDKVSFKGSEMLLNCSTRSSNSRVAWGDCIDSERDKGIGGCTSRRYYMIVAAY